MIANNYRQFPCFDSNLLYPFDMEDALLIWCNQCILEHNKLNNCEQVQEMDDLVSGLADGKVLISMISLYSEPLLHSNISTENFALIKQICAKWNNIIIPWLPSELSCSNIQLKGILMTFLMNLFEKFERTQPLIHRKK